MLTSLSSTRSTTSSEPSAKISRLEVEATRVALDPPSLFSDLLVCLREYKGRREGRRDPTWTAAAGLRKGELLAWVLECGVGASVPQGNPCVWKRSALGVLHVLEEVLGTPEPPPYSATEPAVPARMARTSFLGPILHHVLLTAW